MIVFKLGDKVSLIHEDIKGEIVAFVSNKIVTVKTSEGFELNFATHELVPQSNNYKLENANIKTNAIYLDKSSNIKKKIKKIQTDLHLTQSEVKILSLSNVNLLEEQFRRVQTAINACIAEKINNLVIIHGVGTGVLKNELIKKLTSDRRIQKIEPADSKKYGNGATVAHITTKLN
ncbi:MAG: Smr/MutS family protein [Bacteroidota bacterium]|nr:Smr/MutS family protein [Bacteroidota bacterium]